MSNSAQISRRFELQPRDFATLRTLFESRVMTAAQAAVLFFDNRPEAAKKRLQILKCAGLIATRPRRSNEPAVLYLPLPGLKLLQSEGILSEYPSLDLPTLERRAQVRDSTVRHELEVMDVKVAFHSAFSNSSTSSLVEFSTWPLLHQFESKTPDGRSHSVLVKPDGYIQIVTAAGASSGEDHHFFLELDRSTESLDTLVAKAAIYLSHYRCGGFAARNGAPRSRFREYPIRVLFVLKSAERRNNLAERLISHSPPILTMAYLTTFEEVCRDPLGSIWIRPLDLRTALQETEGSPTRHHPQRPYSRNRLRDALIESRISKQRLF